MAEVTHFAALRLMAAGRSPNWLIEGRNKKSVTANLRVPEGQALFCVSYSGTLDILVENFTPGTMERWNLGWDEVHAINPKLIMVRVSGYGQTGPYSKRAGYDRIALGFSGYMYPTGFPDRFPVRPAFPTADYNTGTFAALATMFALYERDMRGGEGQMIDLALYEARFVSLQTLSPSICGMALFESVSATAIPHSPQPVPFATRDGRYVQIAAGGDNVFKRLTKAMGMPELAEDERYATSRERIQPRRQLESLLTDWIGERDFHDIEAAFVSENVPFGGIYTAEDIVNRSALRSA